MRHLLLIKNAAAIRNRSGQVRDDFPPVSLACCNHFFRARVVCARFLQIKSIKRLIHDKCIVAISPRSHHRGRDIERPRPHRDANWRLHRRTFRLCRRNCERHRRQVVFDAGTGEAIRGTGRTLDFALRGARDRPAPLSALRARATFYDRAGHETQMAGRSRSQRNFCKRKRKSGRSSAAFLLRPLLLIDNPHALGCRAIAMSDRLTNRQTRLYRQWLVTPSRR